jgi:hypothetical protein
MKKLFLFFLFLICLSPVNAIEYQGYGIYDSSIDTHHYTDVRKFQSLEEEEEEQAVPLTIDGLKLWFSAQDVVDGEEPSNNDNITTWQDLSGLGDDLTITMKFTANFNYG